MVCLLALIAAGEPVRRAIVVGRRGGGGAIARFAVPADGNLRSWALEQLGVLAELRDRGMREPLPLACETAAAYVNALPRSAAAAMGAAAEAWTSGFNYPKEDQDPEHVFAFGDALTFDELWALAQPGSDGHFATLATRLWEGPRQWTQM